MLRIFHQKDIVFNTLTSPYEEGEFPLQWFGRTNELIKVTRDFNDLIDFLDGDLEEKTELHTEYV